MMTVVQEKTMSMEYAAASAAPSSPLPSTLLLLTTATNTPFSILPALCLNFAVSMKQWGYIRKESHQMHLAGLPDIGGRWYSAGIAIDIWGGGSAAMACFLVL